MNVACPGPLPDVVPIVIHVAPFDAVHVHPCAVETDAAPCPPLPEIWCADGDTEYEQPFACATATLWPDTTTPPFRAGPTLAAIASGTCARPLPLVGPDTVIHGTSDAIDQRHPAPVSTWIGDVAPAAGAFTLSGFTETLHPPACRTVTVLPAIVAVPVRSGSFVPGTRNRTEPEPFPLLPLTIVIHGVWLSAVHGQPGPALTLICQSPPEGAMFTLSADLEYEHPIR